MSRKHNVAKNRSTSAYGRKDRRLSMYGGGPGSRQTDPTLSDGRPASSRR